MSMDGLEDDVAPARLKPKLEYPLGEPPEPGVAREIAPGVHWVRMPLPFALQWINLWLLEDGDGWTQSILMPVLFETAKCSGIGARFRASAGC